MKIIPVILIVSLLACPSVHAVDSMTFELPPHKQKAFIGLVDAMKGLGVVYKSEPETKGKMIELFVIAPDEFIQFLEHVYDNKVNQHNKKIVRHELLPANKYWTKKLIQNLMRFCIVDKDAASFGEGSCAGCDKHPKGYLDVELAASEYVHTIVALITNQNVGFNKYRVEIRQQNFKAFYHVYDALDAQDEVYTEQNATDDISFFEYYGSRESYQKLQDVAQAESFEQLTFSVECTVVNREAVIDEILLHQADGDLNILDSFGFPETFECQAPWFIIDKVNDARRLGFYVEQELKPETQHVARLANEIQKLVKMGEVVEYRIINSKPTRFEVVTLNEDAMTWLMKVRYGVSLTETEKIKVNPKRKQRTKTLIEALKKLGAITEVKYQSSHGEPEVVLTGSGFALRRVARFQK